MCMSFAGVHVIKFPKTPAETETPAVKETLTSSGVVFPFILMRLLTVDSRDSKSVVLNL